MIWAVVKFRFAGMHRWKKADGKVEFLKALHRHMFYVTVQIEQLHNDRDIEYISFKEWLLRNKPRFEPTDSCEMYAQKVLKKIEKKYPNRIVFVQVMEDDENGAIASKENDCGELLLHPIVMTK